MVRLVILSFFLTATTAVILRDNYDIVTKFNCWRDAKIFLDRGLIFRFEEVFLNNWPGNSAFDCEMPVESLYKGGGIISVIQHMNFRETQNSCIDHIRFNRENNYLQRLCGEMLMGQTYSNGTTWNSPTFVSEFAGSMHTIGRYSSLSPGANVVHSRDTYLHIHVDRVPMEPGESLAFSVSFTGFVECDGLNVPEGMFNCGYGVCILEMFVGDGVVNCPFGDCRDEGSCNDALEDIDALVNGNKNGDYKIRNTTEAVPMISRPFLRWLQNNREETGLSTGQTVQRVVQELETIKEEVKKNSIYLEKVIQLLEGKQQPLD